MIKGYVYSICITLLVVSILSVIIPEGKLKAFTSAIMSVFVLFSFVSPIKEFKGEIHLPYSLSDENLINDTQEAYTKLVEGEIIGFLKNSNIESSKVSCALTISDTEININSVKVVITDKYNKNDVEKLLFENMGIVAEVCYIGE